MKSLVRSSALALGMRLGTGCISNRLLLRFALVGWITVVALAPSIAWANRYYFGMPNPGAACPACIASCPCGQPDRDNS
jgi:hypothetical protein